MSDTSAATFYDRYWAFRTERGDTTAPNRVKLRHEQAAEFIQRRFPDSQGVKVLDLGCGDGLTGQLLKPSGYQLTGVDISTRALGLAQPYYQHTRLLDLDGDDTPCEWLNAFDAVVCLEVLEHLQRPQRNIERAYELCRLGGVAVFSFPNLFSWRSRWYFLRGRWPAGYTTYHRRGK